jgi:hypothetical protein
LVSINWNGFGISPLTWATLIVVVTLIITSLVVVTRRDIAYALVIIWALIGIAVKQNGNQTIVSITEIGAAVVAIELAATVVLKKLWQK